MNGNNTRVGSLTVPVWITNQSTTIFIGNNAANTVATLTVSGATTPYYGFGGRLVDSPLNSLSNLSGGTTVSGATLALVKDGPNTLNLSGSNTYSGGTSIYGGYLQVSNPAGMVNASATGTGSVTVYGGALAGSLAGGSVAGAVTVQNGGEIMPGGINASGVPLNPRQHADDANGQPHLVRLRRPDLCRFGAGAGRIAGAADDTEQCRRGRHPADGP